MSSRVMKEKLRDQTPRGGNGQYIKGSGTREADFKTAPSSHAGWSGVTKGKTKHTYKGE